MGGRENSNSRIFSGTDYLGLSHHPAFLQLLLKGQQKYGIHYGGSRWSNTCPDIYDESESWLREHFEVEEAAVVSSGSLAGSFLLELSSCFDRIVYLKKNAHPATIIPPEKALGLNGPEELNTLTPDPGSKIAVLVNAIDPTTVEAIRPDSFEALLNNAHATVIVDDSHGIGLTGAQGKGFIADFQARYPDRKNDILVMASLGKAYSLPAGILLGPSALLTHLKSQPRWGGASPPAPAFLYALMKGTGIFEQQRQRLHELTEQFLGRLERPQSFVHIPDFPVFRVLGKGYADYLKQAGFTISSFAYPDLNGSITERIVINGAKRMEEVRELADWINKKTASE